MKHKAAILAKFGITIPKEAQILDFGCGAGRTVYSLLDQGFINAVGYDIRDYLSLRDPADRSRFLIADAVGRWGRLPFDDNTFDLVISEEVFEHVMDQVGILRELYRVMRPGGCAIHVIPARYSLLDGHSYVPLGGILGHRWWYKLWALLGIRNEHQQGISANEVADSNAYYFVERLNYVPNSSYEVVWPRLGYDYKWIENEHFDTSERALLRILGKLNRMLPLICWLSRTFLTRHVLLRKPVP
jgi:SAM-dependent methyltransferase